MGAFGGLLLVIPSLSRNLALPPAHSLVDVPSLA